MKSQENIKQPRIKQNKDCREVLPEHRVGFRWEQKVENALASFPGVGEGGGDQPQSKTSRESEGEHQVQTSVPASFRGTPLPCPAEACSKPVEAGDCKSPHCAEQPMHC